MNRTQVCAGGARSEDGTGTQPRPPARPSPGRFEIRQASAEDSDALTKFLAGLSLRSRYLRFFTGGVPAGGAMLAILTGTRPNTDAVVATDNGMIIGHAMAMDTPGTRETPRAAEIGVVVADAWQGNGVGSALVREVAAHAQARGATALVMAVLAENRLVLNMIAKRWPAALHVRSGPSVTVHAEMAPSSRGAGR
jgi:GNAT superfamily N-acetyltransferase